MSIDGCLYGIKPQKTVDEVRYFFVWCIVYSGSGRPENVASQSRFPNPFVSNDVRPHEIKPQ